jgi:quercetin dioxygenase-like cupin family protein
VSVIFKKFNQENEVVDFPEAGSSRRVIDARDQVNGTVTKFEGCRGGKLTDLSHPFDEAIYVAYGFFTVTLPSGEAYSLSDGDVMYIEAGNVYSVEFHATSLAICFFPSSKI